MNNVKPNQVKLSFVIANDKPSYVSKEHSICLFSVAKEAALNEQQIKPCVPLKERQSVNNLIFFTLLTAINKRIMIVVTQKTNEFNYNVN